MSRNLFLFFVFSGGFFCVQRSAKKLCDFWGIWCLTPLTPFYDYYSGYFRTFELLTRVEICLSFPFPFSLPYWIQIVVFLFYVPGSFFVFSSRLKDKASNDKAKADELTARSLGTPVVLPISSCSNPPPGHSSAYIRLVSCAVCSLYQPLPLSVALSILTLTTSATPPERHTGKHNI